MLLVQELMVRNPAVSESWHLVAQARRTMLANSFTCLPIAIGSQEGIQWKLLTDASLVEFVYATGIAKDRKTRISTRIDEAVASKQLHVHLAVCCRPDTPIDNLAPRMNGLPVLIAAEGGNNSELVSIITPFDLL